MTLFTIDDYLATGSDTIHQFIYGPAKTKKTWWAGTAAEAGYNVTFLYCDKVGGLSILSQLPDAARQRIGVIPIKDKISYPVASFFMAKFIRGQPFIFDMNTGGVVSIEGAMKKEHHHVYVQPKKLNLNDVVVLDSYSGVVDSIQFQYASENGIDLSQAAKETWEGYRWEGQMASHILNGLDKLPCHVIVIGHEQNYEIRKDILEPGAKKAKSVVLDIRKQAKSTSGPHGMTISQDFQNMLNFKLVGTAIKIDAQPKAGHDIGSCLIKPGEYNWDDLKFPALARKAKIEPKPDLVCEAFQFLQPGEKPDMDSSTVQKKPSAAIASSSGPLKIAT